MEFKIGSSPNYFSRHKVLNVETNEQVIRDVAFNFIELPKFTKAIDQLETSIDQWAFFIEKCGKPGSYSRKRNGRRIEEAYREADRQNWTKAELEDYERASIKERDEIGRIEFAEKKAKMEGKMEERLDIARNLKDKGVEINIIADVCNRVNKRTNRKTLRGPFTGLTTIATTFKIQ